MGSPSTTPPCASRPTATAAGSRSAALSSGPVRTGRYRVRVVLQSGGDRDLRVVGNPVDAGVRLARAYTVVRVLG